MGSASAVSVPATGVLLEARMLSGCRHKLALDAVAPSLFGIHDAGVRQRREAAELYRAQVRDQLAGLFGPDSARWWAVSAGLSWPERVGQTLRAMRAGVGYIWGAVLPDDPANARRGRAELLIADGGGYVPVIVVNHKVADPRQPEPGEGAGVLVTEFAAWNPERDLARKLRAQPRDLLRLAHLYRMLERLGFAAPSMVGGVIGQGMDKILIHQLESVLPDYDRVFADRVAVTSGAAETGPSRIPECRNCPWWNQRCRVELTHARDVSLVAMGARAEVLRAEGVRTVDELAQWSGPAPQDWAFEDFTDAVVTARAWLAGVPIVRRTDEIAVRRADVEIDVDMESYHESGAYLWGTLLNGRYRGFVTWDPLPSDDEGRSFGEFWTWLIGKRTAAHAAGKTFAAYCCSRHAEDKWLLSSARRFAGAPGVPTIEQVREFIDSADWVDMYQAVSEQLICPAGKGLKKVAPAAGFSWRDPEAGGEASMSWYRAAVGWEGPVDETQRVRILRYNEDDVRATAALREWMSGPIRAQVPTADQIRCGSLPVPDVADQLPIV